MYGKLILREETITIKAAKVKETLLIEITTYKTSTVRLLRRLTE